MSFCAQSARGPTRNTEAGSRISIPLHPHASMARNALQQADQSALTASAPLSNDPAATSKVQTTRRVTQLYKGKRAI